MVIVAYGGGGLVLLGAVIWLAAGFLASYTDLRTGIPSLTVKTPDEYFKLRDNLTPLAIVFDMILLFSPYAVYFAHHTFVTPHDCFVCFNRLQNRRYSIYQFTQEEKNAMRDRQYGQGAIERFEHLLEEDKLEVDRMTMIPTRERQETVIKSRERSQSQA
jgi:hypothetical protein